MKIKDNIDLIAITAFLVILFLVVLPTNALGQDEKISLTIECTCMGEKYLLKVSDPADGYKLLGEKKFTGEELTSWSDIYLDKKFMGKELYFELISMSSGETSSKYAYIMEEGQIMGFYPP